MNPTHDLPARKAKTPEECPWPPDIFTPLTHEEEKRVIAAILYCGVRNACDRFCGAERRAGWKAAEEKIRQLEKGVFERDAFITAKDESIAILTDGNQKLCEQFKAMADRYCAHFCYHIRPEHVVACQEATRVLSSISIQ